MIFREIKFKNFLSYGNNTTSFKFDNEIKAISGINGAGKSTLADAIFFVLTGKVYRNTNKTKLVNTFNKKDCLVQLVFDVGNNSYLVKRGIKPNIFEIYKNDVLLDEDSSVHDYQSRLEMITGLTPKIIEQILIISNRFYKPFLELSASEKRTFTETIFDIDVLSDVSTNLKHRLASVKEKELILSKDVERIVSNMEVLKSNKSKMVDIKETQEAITKHESEIEENKNQILYLNTEQLSLVTNKKELQGKLKNYDKAIEKRYTCNSNIKSIRSQLNKVTDICPTCNQKIKGFNKEEKVAQLQSDLDLWEGRLTKINNMLESLRKFKEEIDQLEKNENKLLIAKRNLESDNSLLTEKINHGKKSIEQQAKLDKDNDDKLKKLKKEKTQIETEKAGVTKEKNNITVLQKLLSEKGLRKYIFNKHIAILNKHVNDNLKMLSAKYQIKFDDEFNESIIAGGYDDLKYGNLSAGEKQRLDLSLVFAFLEIARMKNNVNSNLLVCDEMFGDLDYDGMEGIRLLFAKLKNDSNCVTVITHEDRIKELAESSYTVEKKKFSKLEKD